MFGDMFQEDGDGGGGSSAPSDASGRRSGAGSYVPPLPRLPCGLCGIHNQGATCYLNSLIQTLLYTPEFREALFKLGPDELGSLETADHNQVRVIPIQLQHLFARLLLANQQAVSTSLLTDSFGWTNHEELQQHDVQELNRILFSAIEDSLVATSGERLISQLFHGSIVNQIICQNCGRISEREESFLDLPVTVVGSDGLGSSLQDNFVTMETMDGNNQYRCSACDKLVNARKGARLRSLPPVLTFSLLRFAYDLVKFERYKETRKFIFPLQIDMAGYCEDSAERAGSVYELFSVVIHRGSTHGGHYHAYIRDIDSLGTWSHPDEERIILPPDPESGKLDLLEISAPVDLLHMILYRHGDHGMPIDKLCGELTKQTGVSWNKRFKKNNGPINKFLKKYSDVFILNPDSNWVSLKTHVAPKAVDTSLLTPTVSDLIEHPKSNTDVRDNSRQSQPPPEDKRPPPEDKRPPPEDGHAWFDFDDSRVQPITVKDIEKQFSGKESAYMLFYRKCSMKRPQAAKQNNKYGIPVILHEMVEQENLALQAQREAYELKMNSIIVTLHFGVNYAVSDGVLNPLPETCHCMEVEVDQRRSITSLREVIAELGGELVPPAFVIHRCVSVPAGIHLTEQISVQEADTISDAGIGKGSHIFIWDGKEVRGDSVLIGEEFTPILLTITNDSKPPFCCAFPKNLSVGELKQVIGNHFSLEGSSLNIVASTSNGEKLQPLSTDDQSKSLCSLGLVDLDQIIVMEQTNVQDIVAKNNTLRFIVQNRCSKPDCAGDGPWPLIPVQLVGGSTVADLKKAIVSELCVQIESRLRVDDSFSGIGPPLHEDQSLSDLGIKSGMNLVIEPGNPPTASQITLICSSEDQKYEDLELTFARTSTVEKCLRIILKKYAIKDNNWHLSKTNWCGEAAAILDDFEMSLDQCHLRNGEKILLRPGKLPPKGHMKLNVWLYPRPPAISSHVSEFEIIKQQEEMCHPTKQNETVLLGEVVISKEATLDELKEYIMTLPGLQNKIIPMLGFLRIRKLEGKTPGCVFKSPDTSLRRLKLNTDRICVQILDYEERLTQNQILLSIQQRVSVTRSYLPPYEIVWDTSKGATFASLQQTIADSLALPAHQVSTAKHIPDKYEWMPLRENARDNKNTNNQSRRKKGHLKENIKQAPYQIKDGDTIGVKDLELDPMDSDDFCTESDDQGKERLRLEAEERRQRREAKKRLNDAEDVKMDEKEPTKRKPELGIKIHVAKFR